MTSFSTEGCHLILAENLVCCDVKSLSFKYIRSLNSLVPSCRHWGSVAAILGSAIDLWGNLEEITKLLCAFPLLICKMRIKHFVKATLFTNSY